MTERVMAAGAGQSYRVTEVSRWDRLVNNQTFIAFLFLFPSVLVLASVVIYPFFDAIIISFQDKYVGAEGKFIGIRNYTDLFKDRGFTRVIYNTFIYTFGAVGTKFVLGLCMALVLSQKRFLNNIFRTLLFIPWAVPTVVAALNFRWIYDDFSGMINNILLATGLTDDVISWLADPDLAMYSVIGVVVWSGTPFYTMSFLAGLQAIPRDLYEAAKIDGASLFHEFWYITLPSLKNVFLIVVMLSTIWTSTNLVVVLILTNGGPANRTQILPNAAYDAALAGGRLGFGSAINMVFFPMLAVLIIFLTRQMLKTRD